MKRIFVWLGARLREPTTWAGVAALAVSVRNSLPAHHSAFVDCAAAVAGAVAAGMSEKP